MLSDDDIANGELTQYDAVIAGVRLYNTNDRMKFLNAKLLQYVKDGGIMVVQYNTTETVTDSIGPYPFQITHDRVTDERATVTILKPDASILNTPNKNHSKRFRWMDTGTGTLFSLRYR
jgi:hypothetical protein